MRYRMLGGLEVWDGNQWHDVRAAKPRSILTLLLINANRFVAADAVIAELWDERPPASAEKTLRVYVSRLRHRLPPVQEGLLTRPRGYELRVAPGERDVDRFDELVDAGLGVMAAGSAAESVERLSAALGLWRGEPMAGTVASPVVAAETDRLSERRMVAWEALAEAKLSAGQHDEIIPELRRLVAEHPLREGLWCQLMTALFRSGRRADALSAYLDARRVLTDELGLEPGEQLRRVHREILAGTGPRMRTRNPPPAPRRPVRQLVADVPDFVGRAAELARADAILADGDGAPAGRRVVVVTGQAGVGKSAFTVHVAHLMKHRYPDGQLYANLRGGQRQPAQSGDVLATMLESLGVGRGQIPTGGDRRAGLFRDLLAERRVVIVLDNAAGEEQVRPLLPGGGASAVLITSRTALAGLEGTHRIELDVLSEAEAVDLLARTVGDERGLDDPVAASRLVALCGGLPLALRIAGARLASRRHWSMSRLVDALSDERRRLDELCAGDLAVRASFGLTYDALDEPTRRAYRLLGMLDAPTFPAWVLGSLLGCDHVAGERTVETLTDCRLLEVAGTDRAGQLRYRFHDLLRLYARERAAAHECPEVRTVALERLCEAYADLAMRAEQGCGSILGPLPLGEPQWRLPVAVADRLLANPGWWLESERATVNSLVRQAAETPELAEALFGRAPGGSAAETPELAEALFGRAPGGSAADMTLPRLAWRLAAAMAGLFEREGHFEDWRQTHELALDAACRASDRLGVAVLQRSLGELHTIQDRYGEAIASFEIALDAYRVTDRSGEAATAAGLGVLHRLRGNYRDAETCFHRSIASARATANARARAYALAGLSAVHMERGDLSEARRLLSESLTTAQDAGYWLGTSTAMRSLGLADLAAGRLDGAAERMRAARTISAGQGDRVGEVHSLHWLGHIADLAGDGERAADILDWCLSAYQRFGERFGVALTLRTRAELDRHAGRHGRALAGITRSLVIWRRIESPYWTARTLDTLAAVHRDAGRPQAAGAAETEAAELRAAMDLSPDLRAETYHGRPVGGHLRQVISNTA
jgi:DNA-binding SARP family transcriptional activator